MLNNSIRGSTEEGFVAQSVFLLCRDLARLRRHLEGGLNCVSLVAHHENLPWLSLKAALALHLLRCRLTDHEDLPFPGGCRPDVSCPAHLASLQEHLPLLKRHCREHQAANSQADQHHTDDVPLLTLICTSCTADIQPASPTFLR